MRWANVRVRLSARTVSGGGQGKSFFLTFSFFLVLFCVCFFFMFFRSIVFYFGNYFILHLFFVFFALCPHTHTHTRTHRAHARLVNTTPPPPVNLQRLTLF